MCPNIAGSIGGWTVNPRKLQPTAASVRADPLFALIRSSGF
jgi:hypothetical protein